MEIYFSLGSNLGDREANMHEALRLLDEQLGVHWTGLSSFWVTEPWGFESEQKFLNAAVRYELDLEGRHHWHENKGKNEVRENRVLEAGSGSARENAILAFGLDLLDICKNIEAEMGRCTHALWDEDGKRIYTDRPIDIDILFIGSERLQSERLTVPHPLIGERDFVLFPLQEILSENIRNDFPEIFRRK